VCIRIPVGQGVQGKGRNSWVLPTPPFTMLQRGEKAKGQSKTTYICKCIGIHGVVVFFRDVIIAYLLTYLRYIFLFLSFPGPFSWHLFAPTQAYTLTRQHHHCAHFCTAGPEPLPSTLYATSMCFVYKLVYCGQLAGGNSKTEQATDTVDALVSLQKRKNKKTITRRLPRSSLGQLELPHEFSHACRPLRTH
jgi:hypothetical protein